MTRGDDSTTERNAVYRKRENDYHAGEEGTKDDKLEKPAEKPDAFELAIVDVGEPADSQSDSDNSEGAGNCFTRTVESVETKLSTFVSQHRRIIKIGILLFLLILYTAYFIYCLTYRFGDGGSIGLMVVTAILVLIIVYQVRKAHLKKKPPTSDGFFTKIGKSLAAAPRIRMFLRYGLYILSFVGVVLYLALEVFPDNPTNVQSLLGIFGIVIICFLLSRKPSKINWHPVYWGFVIQFVFATITLQTQAGYSAFKWLGDAIEHLLSFSDNGSEFVIARDFDTMGLAFASGGMIIFFGCLMGLLMHWGVIDFIVIKTGNVLAAAMETGPVESVVAVANIFIGMSEAPLLIRPYLPYLSTSELTAVLTCGYASVSGGLMAMFIAFGAPPNHLLTAAIISAPAALACSKILVPETQRVDLMAQRMIKEESVDDKKDKSKDALGAASDGAVMAVKLLVASMANMLAFVSLLALVDAILLWMGERAGIHNLTFDTICGYILFPLAYSMGVHVDDCQKVGSLIGVKLFATPIVAYGDLGKLADNREIFEDYVNSGSGNNTWYYSGDDIVLEATGLVLKEGIMTARSEAIATYAMCGFSAFTAIGISIGTVTPLCPSRKAEIISLVPPAFIGGNMASFLTGAVAGLLFSGND